MAYDEDPTRDADRSDEEAAQARAAEQNRETDEAGNHAQRVDEPADRGASEDDGGQEDRPDDETVRRRIFEASGMTEEEAQARLTRERGYDPDLPMVSHVEAFETGYAGQVPDPTPNEAYTVSGQVTGEAAAQDRAAASRGRMVDDSVLRAHQVARGRVPDDE